MRAAILGLGLLALVWLVLRFMPGLPMMFGREVAKTLPTPTPVSHTVSPSPSR